VAIVERTYKLVRVPVNDILAAMNEAEKSKQRELEKQIKSLEAKKPPMPVAMGMQDASGPVPKTFVLERGELSNAADEVHPGFPVVLLRDTKPAPAQVEKPRPTTTGRRSALAAW